MSILVLQWRLPDPPLTLRWRGLDDGTMAAIAAGATPVAIAAIVGPMGADATPVKAVGFPLGDGSSVLQPGDHFDLRLPFACAPLRWTILADREGSIEIDLRACPLGDYPPGEEDSITGGAHPAITAVAAAEGEDLDDWADELAARAVVRAVVLSVAEMRQAILQLDVAALPD